MKRHSRVRALLCAVALCTADLGAQERNENLKRCTDSEPGIRWAVSVRIEKCTELIESRTEPSEVLSQAYNSRAIAYTDKGQYDRAIQDFDQAIRLNPKYSTAFYNRGVASCKRAVADGLQREYSRAIQDFDQAIKLEPDLAEAFTWRGRAYDNKGEPERAIRDYDQAIRLDPNLAYAFVGRGAVYAEHEFRFERAIDDFNKAVTLNPNYGEAFYNRGLVKRRMGDFAGGDADIAKGIQLDPNLHKPEVLGSTAPTTFVQVQTDRQETDNLELLAELADWMLIYLRRDVVVTGIRHSDHAVAVSELRAKETISDYIFVVTASLSGLRHPMPMPKEISIKWEAYDKSGKSIWDDHISVTCGALNPKKKCFWTALDGLRQVLPFYVHSLKTNPPGPISFGGPPEIEAFAPSGGSVGTQVIIRGWGFSCLDTVTFGGVAAKFSINSGRQVTATVPEGAKTGKVGVACGSGSAGKGKFEVR